MKSEKEKMLNGEVYNPSDPELIDRWHRAKQLQKEYNNCDTLDGNKLESILEELIGDRGDNVWITAPIYVDYGENIYIGNNVEINMGCTFLDCNKITIGDNSGIGPNVQFYAVGHPINAQERLSGNGDLWKSNSAPITIGKNVWIGGGSIILQGVTIGNNTTIGAGSVVTKDIPSNVLAVGNPCKVIKNLTN
ncbi:MAG: sugar O-acetyltransferase [Muribaculaceae bacterium]|nr:sugar O-acetyltransferase [Muribaculaceae bacterium]